MNKELQEELRRKGGWMVCYWHEPEPGSTYEEGWHEPIRWDAFHLTYQEAERAVDRYLSGTFIMQEPEIIPLEPAPREG